MKAKEKKARENQDPKREQLTGKVGVSRRIISSLEKQKFNLSLKTRMKELREKHNMTQEQLADRVGVRRETILFLEKGKYNPSLRLAYSIAKVLKSRIEDVFFYE